MGAEARVVALARSSRLKNSTKTGSTVAAFSLGRGRTLEHPSVLYGNSNTATLDRIPDWIHARHWWRGFSEEYGSLEPCVTTENFKINSERMSESQDGSPRYVLKGIADLKCE